MSVSEVTSDTNVSNLFRIESIINWAFIVFWGYFKDNVFKPSIISLLFSVVISEESTHCFSFRFEFQSEVSFSEYRIEKFQQERENLNVFNLNVIRHDINVNE